MGIAPIEFLLMSLAILVPLILVVLLLLIITRWVNKSLEVKKERNNLLKEILKVLVKSAK